MDTLFKPLKLRPETVRAIEEIRTGADNPLYAATADKAEETIRRYIKPLVEGTGMSDLAKMHYGWFLRELTRIWRIKTGRELAFLLELTIRKWVNLGLEPNTVQFLVTETHERLKAQAAGDYPPMGSGQERTGSGRREPASAVLSPHPRGAAKSAAGTSGGAR